MKRFLLICAVAILLYACDKETDAAYDTRLFQELQAHHWILDSARRTDSLGVDSVRYAVDTVNEITQFNSQLYIVNNVRMADSAVLDTLSNQIIYDNPRRMYYYNVVSQQIIPNQYFDIDTVNAETLRLTKVDTFKAVTRSYYHAQ